MQLGIASSSVGLGDLLIVSGDRSRGERLLRASLADMNYVAHDLKRGDFWYTPEQAIASALLGDRHGAIAALRRAAARPDATWALGMDPAFNALTDDPEYQALLRESRQRATLGRQDLERLRAEGRVPMRGNAIKSAPLPGTTNKPAGSH